MNIFYSTLGINNAVKEQDKKNLEYNEFVEEIRMISSKLLKELDKIDDTPVIKRSYKFINHPIKWFKDVNKIKTLNKLNKIWWSKNKDLVYKAQEDIVLYGTSIVNKKDIK